jgi:hypothetical protein
LKSKMKIQNSIRDAFDAQLAINNSLKKIVDDTLEGAKHGRWHYESRTKELESFAVKLESGRVDDPFHLEDFLACTLVVPNASQIDEAIKLVRKFFSIRYRRPKIAGQTHKQADSFPFDDVRLYVVRKQGKGLPPDPIDNVVFEIQVKTFLQHAWGIATHDFGYKSDEVSWGKDRVVAHLKAALEHVELSLKEAETLAKSPAVALVNPQTKLVADAVSLLKKHWKRSDLPKNLRGLGSSIADIMKVSQLSHGELDEMLSQLGKSQGGLPMNLSPYGVVLTAILGTKAADLDQGLSQARRSKILLTPELILPAGFPSAEAAEAIVQL